MTTNPPTIDALLAENERLRALISEEHIERLAKDIAVACGEPWATMEKRYRAMVRLGQRLRKPLASDLAALTTETTALKAEVERLTMLLNKVHADAKANAYGADHVICYSCADIAALTDTKGEPHD